MCLLARTLLLLLGSTLACAGTPLDAKVKVVALVFLSSECPISNKMAPEIERLHQKFSTNEVLICLVYPNRSDTEALIEKHRETYRLHAPFVRDPTHELVKKAEAAITPEAAVFDEKRTLVYHGRINDQFLTIGRARPQATTHDLEEAIEAAVAGRTPKVAITRAIGCYIEEK